MLMTPLRGCGRTKSRIYYYYYYYYYYYNHVTPSGFEK